MTCEEYPEPIWWAMKEKDDGYLKPIYPKMVLKTLKILKKLTQIPVYFIFLIKKNCQNITVIK